VEVYIHAPICLNGVHRDTFIFTFAFTSVITKEKIVKAAMIQQEQNTVTLNSTFPYVQEYTEVTFSPKKHDECSQNNPDAMAT
jgi:hypothetical protein